MIILTENAVKQVRSLIAQNDLVGHGLRVGVSPGGCSGYSYVLDIVEGSEEDDILFEQDGIPIFCDPKSHIIVDGLHIDYDTSMMGGGFRFDNPNAKKSCGCGTSFAC